jgi:hypothetical protein
MPLPKTMKGCMHKVSKEYPKGRSKKKMSKKAAHKQHVAMCLTATESIHDMTFKDFLIMEMATGAKIVIDYMSGEDGAKIRDVLDKDEIKYTDEPNQVIVIDMNRNSLAGAALLSHLHRTAKFEDISDVDETNWSFKEGLNEDKVTDAVKRLGVNWEKGEKNEEGDKEILFSHPNDEDAWFMIYYDLDDLDYIGWAEGTKNRKGQFRGDGSGTDSLSTTIKLAKNWLKESFNEGEEMCSTKCCGKPVSKCHCGPKCPHCDCYKKNKQMNESSSWPVSDPVIETFWEYYEDGMSDDDQREIAGEEWSDKFTDNQIDDGTFDQFIDHAQEIYSRIHG